MKRIMNVFAIAVTALFLTTQIGLAQHSEHHKGEKADTTKSATGNAMMPMQQQMMGGNATAPRGMMRSGNNQGQSMKQGSGMMGGKGMMQGGMHGKGMMQGGMMGGKGMMQCGMMGGKGMMQGGMHGKGMMQGGMMAMSDPVIQTLHNSGCPGFLLKSAEALNLTDAQKATLESLKLDFQKRAVKNKASFDVAKIEVKQLLNLDNPNFNKIKTKIKEIGATEQNLRTSFLNNVVQARKVLTKEQLKKVKSLSTSCRSGMMGMGMNK